MKKILTLILCLLITNLVFSQAPAPTTINMSTGTTSDCAVIFYDSGGQGGNYNGGENFTRTFCPLVDPTTPTLNHISLSFSFLSLAIGDTLWVYDGSTTNANSLIAIYTNSTQQRDLRRIDAYATNAGGCLTVRFKSKVGSSGIGWEANISCVKACQAFKAVIDSISTPILPTSPGDTGWIDLCLGKPFYIKAHGQYEQNDGLYHQSDSTTTIEWNFGDGTNVVYSNEVIRQGGFTVPGGYIMQLTMTDQTGCKNYNYVRQRIRVAPRPRFQLGVVPNQICSGDSVMLRATVGVAAGQANLGFLADTLSFPVGSSRTDTTCLPDGAGEFRTSVRFTNFSPGARLTTLADLVSIGLNMEHTWVRDLEIALVCPNGQRAILHNFIGPSGNAWRMGTPTRSGPVVPGSLCTRQGTGLTYTWTPAATQTLRQYIDVTPVPPSGTVPNTAPFAAYANNLTNLLGCPLNGDWYISVRDQWRGDFGWIFSWNILFNNRLYPNQETFTAAPYDPHRWLNNPFITSYSPDSITVKPVNAGVGSFAYQVQDRFGCNYDTVINVKVLPFTNPTCYSCDVHFPKLRDTTVCARSSVTLRDSTLDNLNPQVGFTAFPFKTFSNALAPPARPDTTVIDVNSIKGQTITNIIGQIDSVCVDAYARFGSDLTFTLVSPLNTVASRVTLVQQRGGSQPYKKTCFTTNAANPLPSTITSYAAGGGRYLPETGMTGWNALLGAPTNGKWRLLSSVAGGRNIDTLYKWSIFFKYKNNITYSWTPATGLSCTNCPEPIATPLVTTRYIVSTIDSFACTHKDTVTITIRDSLAATVPFAIEGVNGHILYGWTAVVGATGYEVSVDGGPWIPANGVLRHQVNGVVQGQRVTICVRAIGGSCAAKIACLTTLYDVCTGTGIHGRLQVDSILCFGRPSAFVNFAFATGNNPINYKIDNVSQSVGLYANQIYAGRHVATTLDGQGCMDTLIFYLGQPDSISYTLTTDSVRCKGTQTGRAILVARGGTLPLHYQWNSRAQDTFAIDTVRAGTYMVTITDANNCRQMTSASIYEPDSLLTTMSQDSVLCFGNSNGAARVVARGGTAPYTYAWSNGGSVVNNVVGLRAGTYIVSVTDARGCIKIDSVRVLQPTALSLSFTHTNVSCAGNLDGSERAIVTGGSRPYTYLWSNGRTNDTVNNIGSAIYFVTITDRNGCTKIGTDTVSESLAIGISFRRDSVRCFGGNTGYARAITTGGTQPLSYSWNGGVGRTTDSISQLTSGMYVFTVRDANNCGKSDSIFIPQIDSMVIGLTKVDVFCGGGSTGTATATVTGGGGGYTYTWSNSPSVTAIASNIRAGLTTVTVRDRNACTNTRSITINQPDSLFTTMRQDSVKCFGGSTGSAKVVVIGGNTPYRYSWSNGGVVDSIGGLRAGTYIVTISDGTGCQKIDSVSVLQPTAISLVMSHTNIRCSGSTDGTVRVVASGGTAPFRYAWSNGRTNDTILNVGAATFTVTVTDGNGCTKIGTETTTTTLPLVLSFRKDSVKCFGASTGYIKAIMTGGALPYIYNWSAGTGRTTDSIYQLPAATYTVTITDANGCAKSDTIRIGQIDSMVLGLTKVDILCAGGSNGSVAATVTGGTSAYTYRWVGSASTTLNATALRAGAVSLTVTDRNLCTKTISTTILQPDSLLTTMSQDSVRCFGTSNGAATVVPRGGVSPYSYAWSNGGSTQNNIVGLRLGNYRVTVTDRNLCTKIDNVNVLQPDSVLISVTNIAAKCFGGSDGIASASATGGSGGYTYLWNNPSGSTTAQVGTLQAGTYTVTVTDLNGCFKTKNVTVGQATARVLTTTKVDAKCWGSSNGRGTVSTTGGTGPYTFSWDNTTAGANITTLNAGSHSVVSTDALGCKDTATIVIGQPDSIKYDSLLSVSALCASQATGSARVIVSGGTAPYTYSWTPSTQTTSRANNLLPGTYTIRVTDNNLCVRRDSIRVGSSPALIFDSLTTVKVRCFNEVNGRARVYVSGGTGAFSYRWSDLGAQRTDTLVNVRAGSYTVTVTDANSCTNTTSVTVTQPTVLAATSRAVNVKCTNGTDGQVIPLVTGGTVQAPTRTYSYLWNDPSSQTDSIASGLRAGTYTVTVSDINACTTTTAVIVTQPDSSVTARARQVSKGCFGQSGSIATVVAAGGSRNFTYAWSFNNNVTSTVSGLPAGLVFVTVSDINGCKFTDSVRIVTYDSIAISMRTVQPHCFGYSDGRAIVDSVTGGNGNGVLGAYQYRWNTIPVQQFAQATNLLGNREYRVTVTDNNGCYGFASSIMQQPVQIQLALVKQNVLCYGDTTGEATVNATGTFNQWSYRWASGGRSDTTQHITGLNAYSRYNVRVIDSAGCFADTSLTVGQPSKLAYSQNKISPLKCFGDTIGAIKLNVLGGTPRYNYSWSSRDTTSSIQNKLAGTYKVTVSDINGCRMLDSFVIANPPLLVAQAATNPAKCFGGRDGSITMIAGGGVTPYTYSTDGKIYNGIQNIVGLRAGDYRINVKDDNGCVTLVNTSIQQPPKFTISTENITINLGQSTTIFATADNNQGFVRYIWKSPYDSILSCKICERPIASPMYTVTYDVTGTDTAGCNAYAKLVVNVEKSREVLVPSGFSPNKDNVNDRLVVHGRTGTVIKVFRVFDRWGETVFEAQNFQINDTFYSWDGSFRGQEMQSGVFFWYIEAEFTDGAKETFKGNTTLIR
jgi:large repetitive protein